MKKLYPSGNSAVFKRCFILVLVISGIIYSCKKDAPPHSTTPLDQKEQNAVVKEAKSWFERNEAINKEQPLATNAVDGVKRKWNDALKPDWDKTTVYSKDKGTIIEMPLFSSAVSFLMNTTNGSQATLQNNYTKATYLIQKDSAGVFKAWFMILVADTSYVNGDFSKLIKNTYQSKDAAYSGRLLYFNVQGKFLAGWRYNNGSITKTITLDDYVVNQQQINNQKIKVNLVQTCTTFPITTVTWQCVTVQINPASVPYTTCTPHYNYSYQTECTTTGDGSGGGSGGGGGTGGGGTFPQPPTNPCPPVGGVASVGGQHINLLPGDGGGTPTPGNPCTPPEDPCAKMKKAKAKFADATNTDKNTQVLNKPGTDEYGSDIKLASPNWGAYKPTPITSNGVDDWSSTFTWNSTDGYAIGSTHRHQAAGPSPDDVFGLVKGLLSSDMASASTTSKQFYRDNAFATVVSSTSTYVITVSNWGILSQMYQVYMQDINGYGNTFQSRATNYQIIHNVDQITATTQILMDMFDGAINLYKAPAGTTNYAIAGLDQDLKLIIIPCPN